MKYEPYTLFFNNLALLMSRFFGGYIEVSSVYVCIAGCPLDDRGF